MFLRILEEWHKVVGAVLGILFVLFLIMICASEAPKSPSSKGSPLDEMKFLITALVWSFGLWILTAVVHIMTLLWVNVRNYIRSVKESLEDVRLASLFSFEGKSLVHGDILSKNTFKSWFRLFGVIRVKTEQKQAIISIRLNSFNAKSFFFSLSESTEIDFITPRWWNKSVQGKVAAKCIRLHVDEDLPETSGNNKKLLVSKNGAKNHQTSSMVIA